MFGLIHVFCGDDSEHTSDDNIKTVYLSLHDISTAYDIHGSGTLVDTLAAAAGMQNADAMAEKVNSMQWASIVLKLHKIPLGDATPEDVAVAMSKLSEIVGKHNDLPEVQATVMIKPSPSKKARCASYKTADDEGDDIGNIVGEKRVKVIQAFLSDSCPEFWKSVQAHISCHGFKFSGWSEKLWQSKCPNTRRTLHQRLLLLQEVVGRFVFTISHLGAVFGT